MRDFISVAVVLLHALNDDDELSVMIHQHSISKTTFGDGSIRHRYVWRCHVHMTSAHVKVKVCAQSAHACVFFRMLRCCAFFVFAMPFTGFVCVCVSKTQNRTRAPRGYRNVDTIDAHRAISAFPSPSSSSSSTSMSSPHRIASYRNHQLDGPIDRRMSFRLEFTRS